MNIEKIIKYKVKAKELTDLDEKYAPPLLSDFPKGGHRESTNVKDILKPKLQLPDILFVKSGQKFSYFENQYSSASLFNFKSDSFNLGYLIKYYYNYILYLNMSFIIILLLFL